MATPKYYLVIDLEATCDADHRLPRHETEIIEIGAVLCDGQTLQPAAELQTFVRPIRHPRLTAFCTELTTIRQADVDGAPFFPQAIERLRRFVDGRDFLFCSWGDYDRNQLRRDAERHRVRLPLGSQHLNLKHAFQQATGMARPLGTGQALASVGLKPEGTHHRGIDDARNIAKLLPYCVGRRACAPAPGANASRVRAVDRAERGRHHARVERMAVESSTIASIGYDGGERILEVEFRNGHVYRYFLVPPLLHRSLMAAESKGTFLNARVKGSFGFVRL